MRPGLMRPPPFRTATCTVPPSREAAEERPKEKERKKEKKEERLGERPIDKNAKGMKGVVERETEKRKWPPTSIKMDQSNLITLHY